MSTSAAAFNSIKGSINALHVKVYNHLKIHPGGLIDEEMQRGMQMNPSTQRPRRGELVELGLIVDSGRRRPTLSGRKAIVWVAK